MIYWPYTALCRIKLKQVSGQTPMALTQEAHDNYFYTEIMKTQKKNNKLNYII